MTESLSHEPELYDITIIGGGPTGLFAAFYSGMRGASCKIIDNLPELGGQLAMLYPEKFIFDVGGYYKVLARDLVEQLKEQAFQYHPTVCLNEQVVGVTKLDDGTFTLSTNLSAHRSKAIIICGGIGVFTPRALPTDKAADYEGNGISYYIDTVDKFKDKQVMVIGGGDTAIDYALMVERVAKKVVLIHRRDQFRAHEDNVRQLFESSIEIKTFAELQDLHGDNRLTAATIVHTKSQELETIELDEIVSGLGFSAALGPMKDWGLDIEGNEIIVNTKMETNIPGIYAAGDVVTYPGKVKLIATGFGEAPTAVNNAKTFIDPKARLSPGHSSNRKE